MTNGEYSVITSHISKTRRNTVVLHDTIYSNGGKFRGSCDSRVTIRRKLRAKDGFRLDLKYFGTVVVFRGNTKDSVFKAVAAYVEKNSWPRGDILTVAEKALA